MKDFFGFIKFSFADLQRAIWMNREYKKSIKRDIDEGRSLGFYCPRFKPNNYRINFVRNLLRVLSGKRPNAFNAIDLWANK